MKSEHGLLPRRVEGLAGRALDPDGLPRRGRPRLHPRDARLLPARAAVGRGAGCRRSASVPAKPGHRPGREPALLGRHGRPALPARLRRRCVRDARRRGRRVHPDPGPAAVYPQLHARADHRDQLGGRVLQRGLWVDRLRAAAADRLPLGGRVRGVHACRERSSACWSPTRCRDPGSTWRWASCSWRSPPGCCVGVPSPTATGARHRCSADDRRP